MTNKTYNQYCAIASALDIIGERWSLLVIRNLLLGPKRFSDLLKGLPGLSTNILTERLKLLTEQNVITTRFLPPPAASAVYELTERGYALSDVLTALARWGSLTLGETPPEQHHIATEGIGFMIMGVFYQGDQPAGTLTCNVRVYSAGYDQTFGIGQTSHGVTFSEAPFPTADVSLAVPLEHLPALSSARVRLHTLFDEQVVHLEGTPSSIRDLLHWVDSRQNLRST